MRAVSKPTSCAWADEGQRSKKHSSLLIEPRLVRDDRDQGDEMLSLSVQLLNDPTSQLHREDPLLPWGWPYVIILYLSGTVSDGMLTSLAT